MIENDNDELSKLMDHEYDGIKELDNDLPPWWKSLFVITVVYGVVYFLGYQLFGWYEQPEQEYQSEIAYWEDVMKTQELAKPQSGVLDINAEIAAGKKIFQTNCFACHGPDGGGTVGPNLTDKYWIYGGSFDEIVKTISKGAPSNKGMQAWEMQLGRSGVQKVARYVMSLQGTSPISPKPAEGNIYEPNTVSEAGKILEDAKSLASGSKLYAQYCAACHNSDLKGSFASNLVDDVWSKGKGTFEDISLAIKNGDVEAKMPAWGDFLNQQQISELTSYILNQKNELDDKK